MGSTRQIAGWVALVSYLVMGAILYFSVLPGADGHWPPDFHLRGYSAETMAGFVGAMSEEARASYGVILLRWDRVFIVALALWLGLLGWRGGALRFVVAGLAVVYALIDFAENAAIYRFIFVDVLYPAAVDAAHQLTMAKFASLYLCILVLIVHLRRSV